MARETAIAKTATLRTNMPDGSSARCVALLDQPERRRERLKLVRTRGVLWARDAAEQRALVRW